MRRMAWKWWCVTRHSYPPLPPFFNDQTKTTTSPHLPHHTNTANPYTDKQTWLSITPLRPSQPSSGILLSPRSWRRLRLQGFISTPAIGLRTCVIPRWRELLTFTDWFRPSFTTSLAENPASEWPFPTPVTYRILMGVESLGENNYKLASLLGWCTELVSSGPSAAA
jgi:hypothetical protein